MSAYHLNEATKKDLIEFLNQLNQLLRKNKLNISFVDGALFSEIAGYLGQLEDNRDHLAINDGQEDVLQSHKINF